MRMIIFFDLPVETLADRREYSRFHRYLIKNGFMMMQESVYSKIILNQSLIFTTINNLKLHKPPKGVVQLLSVTEKQYSKMEYIVGSFEGDIITSDERFIEL